MPSTAVPGSQIEIKEFSILCLILKNLKFFNENAGLLKDIKLFTQENVLIFEKIKNSLGKKEILNFEGLNLDPEIVEKIFDSFVNQGFNNFKLIINYKKELIRSYFNELEHLYNLEFLEESKFLGTIGGIKEFADKLTDNFVVTNCDVVTDINYHNFFEHHIKKDAYLSILGLEKSTKVPYGVLRLDKESNVEGLQEKPKQTHTIMTGIYIINKRALDYIPSDVEFGMDELIETLIANNKAVTSFVIKDGWYDMGQFSEYKKLLMHIDN